MHKSSLAFKIIALEQYKACFNMSLLINIFILAILFTRWLLILSIVARSNNVYHNGNDVMVVISASEDDNEENMWILITGLN